MRRFLRCRFVSAPERHQVGPGFSCQRLNNRVPSRGVHIALVGGSRVSPRDRHTVGHVGTERNMLLESRSQPESNTPIHSLALDSDGTGMHR